MKNRNEVEEFVIQRKPLHAYAPSAGSPEQVSMKETTRRVVGDKSYTTFEMTIHVSGNYYVNTWILGVRYTDGTLPVYDILLNGKETGATIQPTIGGWGAATISTGTLHIEQGITTITFVGPDFDIPHVEFVRLGLTEEEAYICSESYNERLAKLRQESSLKEGQPQENQTKEKQNPNLREDYGPIENQLPDKNYEPDDVWIHYSHIRDIEINYAFGYMMYLRAGQTIDISVERVDGLNISSINFFNMDEKYIYPYNWYKTGKIEIPITGAYYLSLGGNNLYNITLDGRIIENAPSNGREIFSFYFDEDVAYNTFTAYAQSCSPVLIAYNYEYNYKIIGYNDDFISDGLFDWGSNPRIRRTFPYSLEFGYLSIYDYYSYGDQKRKCDLYVGVPEYDPEGVDYGYNPIDVMASSRIFRIYNSVSWTGGIATYVEWPHLETSQYYVEGDALASFDKFYAAERYPGCSKFTREGATEENKVVNLYGFEEFGGISWEHAAIKKGGDRNPHGYAWESKLTPGTMTRRMFHAENSLSKHLGTPQAIYRVETPSTHMLEEMIEQKRAVVEKVRFTLEEAGIIAKMKSKLSQSEITEFEAKYIAWEADCKTCIYTNPNHYRDYESYKELLAFCKTNPILNALVFEKLASEEFATQVLLIDLTITGNKKNKALLEAVKEENVLRQRSSDIHLVISPYANSMKYVKKLLDELK